MMRYDLKTLGHDGRVENFFSIFAPWDDRNVLAAKQYRGNSFLMILFVPMKSLMAYGAYATQTGAVITKSTVPFKEVMGLGAPGLATG